MKKFEAHTLEEAYKQATEYFGCSLADLSCEVVQNPKNGLFGIGKKDAIIVADWNPSRSRQTQPTTPCRSSTFRPQEIRKNKFEPHKQELPNDTISENFFKESKEGYVDDICSDKIAPTCNEPLAKEIESALKELFSKSCFKIDIIEVDVVDNTALIFLDGEDAALLIGKEGYRYNALSYMIFNWLFAKYELFIKLEIARFLTTQKEMICAHLEPIIEIIKKEGRVKTKPFDGILIQIALEKLREEFPNKYVAVKTNKNGEKYILVNDFIRK